MLLARKNFGCGSSREHAPWALEQYGFRAIIAPSFADIFFNNCFKNGLLPIVLPDGRWSTQLFDEVCGYPRLPADRGSAAPGHRQARTARRSPSTCEPFRKYCLLNGFDDIGLTLRHAGQDPGLRGRASGAAALAGAPPGRLSAVAVSLRVPRFSEIHHDPEDCSPAR